MTNLIQLWADRDQALKEYDEHLNYSASLFVAFQIDSEHRTPKEQEMVRVWEERQTVLARAVEKCHRRVRMATGNARPEDVGHPVKP